MVAISKASLLVVQALASTPAGPFKVTEGSYNLGGFLCGNRESKASIWYPSDLSQGPFPIVTYGHGMGGQMIPDLIESVASLGMIVVAPATSGGKCDDNHWKDRLHAIEGSKAKTSLHTALGPADWTRVGIMGPSMGGYGSLNGAADVATNPDNYSFSLKAMLDSHGYIGDFDQAAPKIQIPAMFTTGSEDHASHLKGAFDLASSKNKVLAQVTGADHMYPLTNGALNPWDAHFLGCHVADLQNSCVKIYGSGSDSICKGNSMTQCEVVGSSPSDLEVVV
jgi:dienelactone hydrolase